MICNCNSVLFHPPHTILLQVTQVPHSMTPPELWYFGADFGQTCSVYLLQLPYTAFQSDWEEGSSADDSGKKWHERYKKVRTSTVTINEQEVTEAVAKLKYEKAMGLDDVSGEMTKKGGKTVRERLVKTMQRYYQKSKAQDD